MGHPSRFVLIQNLQETLEQNNKPACIPVHKCQFQAQDDKILTRDIVHIGVASIVACEAKSRVKQLVHVCLSVSASLSSRNNLLKN